MKRNRKAYASSVHARWVQVLQARCEGYARSNMNTLAYAFEFLEIEPGKPVTLGDYNVILRLMAPGRTVRRLLLCYMQRSA